MRPGDKIGNGIARDILRAAEMRALQRLTTIVRQVEEVLARMEKLYSQMTDSVTVLHIAEKLNEEMDEEEGREQGAGSRELGVGSRE